MRVATVLGIAAAYGAIVDVLADDADHPMLRDLGATDDAAAVENESQLLLIADSAVAAPAGSCTWSGSPILCTITAADSNIQLGHPDTCNIPVPVPTDNYVDDKRTNKFDTGNTASKKPYIEITRTFNGALFDGSTFGSGQVAWKEYVTDTSSVLDQFTFNAPGIYHMEMTATDYDQSATCDQCFTVTDEFRPQFRAGCASTTATASLSASAYGSFVAAETRYNQQTSEGNIANNAFSASRCDDTSSQLQPFHGTLQDFNGVCFSDGTLATNLNILKTSPFATDLATAAPALETTLNAACHWHCTKSTTLKERHVAYACPGTWPSEECLGSASCGIDLTLTATGNDIATKSIHIRSAVTTASDHVISALPTPPAGADSSSNVYYAIPCTDFSDTDSSCHYSPKLSDILDAAPHGSNPIPGVSDVTDFVFWRYNLDGSAWVTWDPKADTPITFKDPSTTVAIEAWTGCGQVGATFKFDVKLYVHSTLTCDLFDAMWTLPTSTHPVGGTAYCTYPGSDFAIVTLDMDITDVIPTKAGEVTGNYASAKCEILVKEDGASPDPATKTLVDVTTTTVNEDFAVELVNNPNTAQKTAVTLQCVFTRTAHVDSVLMADTDPHSISCSHSFTLTDCDAPVLFHGDKADVCADECAGNALPGVGEPCGGTVVSASALTTSISTTDQACCAACDPDITCQAVASTSVKRCQIPPPSPLLLADLSAAAAEQESFASTSTMALIGASAMIAVVALVVVKHRANAAERAKVAEDAYYPLLE